jgi:hypothetical protein
MRRGCIAIGKVECDNCQRRLKYGERYLFLEVEGGTKQRLCIACCQKLGYVSPKTERGKATITFFP